MCRSGVLADSELVTVELFSVGGLFVVLVCLPWGRGGLKKQRGGADSGWFKNTKGWCRQCCQPYRAIMGS